MNATAEQKAILDAALEGAVIPEDEYQEIRRKMRLNLLSEQDVENLLMWLELREKWSDADLAAPDGVLQERRSQEELDREIRRGKMAIVAKKEDGGGRTFTPHPEGPFAAVCVDVHDLGMIETTWEGKPKTQHKIDIYFYCGEDTALGDGRVVPMLVRSRYTLTLNEKGNLRKFLEGWRGKKFTPEEEEGFDVEQLIGAPVLIQIVHNQVGDKTYANITSPMKLPKGMQAPAFPENFVRMKDRNSSQPSVIGSAGNDDDPDSLPF